MKKFKGNVLFLDRSDINTDEIIPARYLTELTKEDLKPFLLEDLKMEGFNPAHDIDGKSVVITRANFGCGSSREHAPWALEMNGINLVIAESFARIFRQNMYNCGMIALEIKKEILDDLFNKFQDKDVTIEADIPNGQLIVTYQGEEERIFFELSDFDRALIQSGGWVDFADDKY